jgi:hypothetical protein
MVDLNRSVQSFHGEIFTADPEWKNRGVVQDLSGLARIAITITSKYNYMRFVCRYLGDFRWLGEASRHCRQLVTHLGQRMPKKKIQAEKTV